MKTIKSPQEYCREYIGQVYPDDPDAAFTPDCGLTEWQELEISRAFYAGIECTCKVLDEINSNGVASGATKLMTFKAFRILNAQTAVATSKAPEEEEQ